MGRNAGGLRLHDLGAPHFKTFGGHAGVVGHILCLEGCNLNAPVFKKAAKCGDDNAFADIGTGSQDRQTGSLVAMLTFQFQFSPVLRSGNNV